MRSSLASLRKQASRGGRALDGGFPFTPVRDNVLIALLDVAEAALVWNENQYGHAEMDALADALAAFPAPSSSPKEVRDA